MSEKQKSLPGFSKDNLSEPLYVKTYNELADHFSVHVQTIKNWAKRGMPKAGRGKYDVNAISAWALAENLIDANGATGYSSKFQKEKYLHEKAKRKDRELELAIKTGKFIKIADSKRELITLAQQVKMAILAMPHKMAPHLEGLNATQIQKKLEIAVDEVLRHLSHVNDDQK